MNDFYKMVRDVGEWNAWRREHPHEIPVLREADLIRTNLRGIDLSGVDLSRAKLVEATLVGATLVDANLSFADLSYCDVASADLRRAVFNQAKLSEANLADAVLGGTVFAAIDLSTVGGLETCRHEAPSAIDIASLQHAARLPKSFLLGCGIPQPYIDFLRSSVEPAVHFYSCFISYAARDERFARHLYQELQKWGVRAWYAPEDLHVGDRLRPAIDASLREHDRVLLVTSRHALESSWVEYEVSKALSRENEEGRTILFPLTLDDAVFTYQAPWAQAVRDRVVADFRNWQDPAIFAPAVARLARALAVSTAIEAQEAT